MLYKSLGISKQAVHKYLNRVQRGFDEQHQLLMLIYQIREDHPTMGVRDLYFKIRPETMGRDAFESFCKSANLSVQKRVNYRRTTDSTGVVRFENLVGQKQPTSINEIWQSDITYYEVANQFYYLTFITDSFSRRIVGYSVSRRLLTEYTTLPALEMAIAHRKGEALKGLIFHSDGGGQYYAKDFLKLTSEHGMLNSMCEYAWENGKAERINGIIKNNYLVHRGIKTYEMLVKEVDRSVTLYNHEKPHRSLNRLTPIAFENMYFYAGQKAGGDQSSKELKGHTQGRNSPSGCGQKAQRLTGLKGNKWSKQLQKQVNPI